MKGALIAMAVVVAVAAGYFLFARRGAHDDPSTSSGVRPPASSVQRAVAIAPPGQRAEPGAPFEKATFSSGCFWCTESDFDKVAGVVSTTSGYTGGHVSNPTYNQVSAGGTGHAESVEVMFDPSVVTFEQLLDVYWHNVDPFSSRGQFCDFGEQYRPVIWVHTPAQRAAAEASKQRMQMIFDRPVVVGIEDAGPFYPAEEYHQDFHTKSAVRYNYYRWGCGRDARLSDIWKSVARSY